MREAPTIMDEAAKPTGRAAVTTALTEAAIALIVEEGLHVSVRQIAERARVNHGLVHTYFGSKQNLLAAAADEINRRASLDADESGFPPPDLAGRRGGELATALARIRLDGSEDLFSSHPVVEGWRTALARSRPDLDPDEIDTMVASASALALGWALFADHITELLELSDERRGDLDEHVSRLVADLGGIPGWD